MKTNIMHIFFYLFIIINVVVITHFKLCKLSLLFLESNILIQDLKWWKMMFAIEKYQTKNLTLRFLVLSIQCGCSLFRPLSPAPFATLTALINVAATTWIMRYSSLRRRKDNAERGESERRDPINRYALTRARVAINDEQDAYRAVSYQDVILPRVSF